MTALHTAFIPGLYLVGALFSMKSNAKGLLSLIQRNKASQSKADDLGWIEELPTGNSLAAMEVILKKLGSLIPADSPVEPWQLSCIYKISNQCHRHLATLEKQYVSVQKLSPKIDDLIWNAVHNFYRYLIRGYQACIDEYLENPENSKLQPQHLTILIAHAIDNLCALARWYCMRYQTVPDGHWLKTHKVYLLAEKYNCTGQYFKFNSGIESTINTRYGRALMLDTISFSGMQKMDIARVDEWLIIWMKGIAITAQYNEERHLFYVNLAEDQGARRIRHFQPTDSCRYWEVDRITEGILHFRTLLQKGEKNIALEIIRTGEVDQCLSLLDHLHAEWSRSGYRRQRRREARNNIFKIAYVAHGIQSVYQMVKDIDSIRDKHKGYSSKGNMDLDERLSRHTVLRSAPNIALPWLAGDRWSIQDESSLGYGAIVGEEIASNLKIGKLLAVVMDENRDAVTIGIVRSIRSLSNGEYHVGIEILSREAIPVQLADMSAKNGKLSSEKTFGNTDPFSLLDESYMALVLPENPASGVGKASIVIAIANYIQGAKLSVTHPDRSTSFAHLTDLIEQKDDWARVGFDK